MQMIMPGVYDDGKGGLHLVVPELLRANGYADTPENRDTLTEAARRLLRHHYPTMPITQVDVDPHA